MESILREQINQKIISNKKTSSSCDSFYRAERGANNSDIFENSSSYQANLDASQICLKDPLHLVDVEIPQPNTLFTIRTNRKEKLIY